MLAMRHLCTDNYSHKKQTSLVQSLIVGENEEIS